MTRRRRAGQRGLGTAGLVVTLVVLGLIGFGGWYGYCYYQVLHLEGEMDNALGNVGLFRDGSPTEARIQQKALERIRAKGGRLELAEVKVHVAPLTPTNLSQLSDVWQRKARIACNLKQLGGDRDARIDRIRDAAEAAAGRGRAPRRARPKPRLESGCHAELLESLGWSFVRVEAEPLVKVGLVSKRVKVQHAFYLMQEVPTKADAKKAADDESDDE